MKTSTSIAARLTLWYAILSTVLIACAGSAMYWALADQLRQEDDQLLAGTIAEVRGVLSLHARDLAAFRQEIQRKVGTLPGIQLQVLDSRGVILVAAPAGDTPALGRHLLDDREIEEGTDWTSADGSIYRVMSDRLAIDPGFTVHVAMNRSKEEGLLATYRRTVSLAVFAALGVAVAAGYIIARRQMRPISRLASIVAKLGAARLHHRVGEETWPRELGPLASNFDELLSRLEDSFARVSQFSADIAHELRTPLHILGGEAELALTRARSPEAYRACIESAAEEYQRLTRMVDALLFLARSEQPDAQLDREPLELVREISAICDFYQAIADEQGVTLLVRGNAHAFANSGLLRRALGNLVSNALRHTPAGGRVVVEAAETSNRKAAVSVSDTGSGIAPEDLPHVFERFYRADSARSRGDSGMGLGLAIVKFIMQLHGGSVSIRSETQNGTTVTLTFPGPDAAA